MSESTLVTESTLTERFQTTVPSVVRKALHLDKRDKIQFTIEANGSVSLARVEPIDNDPILDGFLSFLADDMQNQPGNIQLMTASMKSHVESLIVDVDIDLNESLLDEDE
jgi:antitoxin PrlF